jgi:hypothetical protein
MSSLVTTFEDSPTADPVRTGMYLVPSPELHHLAPKPVQLLYFECTQQIAAPPADTVKLLTAADRRTGTMQLQLLL